MLRWFGMLFVITTGVSFASRVFADTAATARKAIQAAYDKENAAVAKKNLEGAFSSVSSDFMAGDKQGHQASLRSLKPQMQAVFDSATSLKAVTQIQKIVYKTDQATVTAKNRTIINLKAPKGQKPSKAIVDSVEEDLWVKTGGKWVRRIATVLSQTMTKNGQPFVPK